MNRIITTLNENLPTASYSVPEIEIRQMNKHGETVNKVEYHYVNRKDKTMLISSESDDVEHVRHVDIQGAEYPLDKTAYAAFCRFVGYSPRVFALRDVVALCDILDIPAKHLYLIRINPRYTYIEFIGQDMLQTGMKIGSSGYIQVFDLNDHLGSKNRPYHLTQFARRHGKKVSEMVKAIQSFARSINYLQKAEEA